MSNTYTIADGWLEGWSLRVRAGELEWRAPAAGRIWERGSARLLARHHAVDSDVWVWLRAHGITRPSPSGPSGTSTARADRTRRKIEISMGADAHARLAEIAEARGTSRSEVVEDLVLRARTTP